MPTTPERVLVLHLGLHKTASSYVQNLLAARRPDLLAAGILYPLTGTIEGRASTRVGATSGHALFTRPQRVAGLMKRLREELTADTHTVLLSSEDFTLRRAADPLQFRQLLSGFDRVKAVLVLRRQDEWLLSWYKQAVDQFANDERRPFDVFLAEEGPTLLDFHTRFTPWRELVGIDDFHVLSYDDLDGGSEICRRILEVAGAPSSLWPDDREGGVARYDSIRAIDTLGLRILNAYRVGSRDERIALARTIYDLRPPGDIELLTPSVRAGIQEFCAPINERLERDWFGHPVPGLRFGADPPPLATPCTSADLVDYLDAVLAVCEAAEGRLVPEVEQQRRRQASARVARSAR
jgi:hypothetical protein